MTTLEPDLIARISSVASRLSGRSAVVPLGMGDDAALFAANPGCQTILTCDWFLEGTHFLRDRHPADAVGWKCLARAISDIAAMGGEPRCFLMTLALPQTHAGRWLDEFLLGLRRAALKFSCPLVGGDTTRSREILMSVTVVGEVRRGHAILRSGARPGDAVFVSGRLGEAELGLRSLRGKVGLDNKDPALKKHLYPEPRLALGRWLSARRIATAMMDLSDGLSSDLPRLCAASGVGARIESASIPAVRLTGGRHTKRLDPLDLALNGGDDYELLFTVRPTKARLIPTSFRGLPITRIGESTREHRLRLLGSDGREQILRVAGWDPFRR